MALTKLKDELVIERQKMHALLEITNAVNRNYQVDDIMSHFENVMRDYIGIKKLAFINKASSWTCILNYGIKGDCSRLDIDQMSNYKTTTLISDTNMDMFSDFELMLPVYHKEKALSYLLVGGLEKEDELLSFIETHVGFVQTLANVVSVAIESKYLAKKLIKKQVEEADMKLAADMQQLLLPSNLPSNHIVDISATYLAKNMVSGDYYDFIPINNTEYVFCIADVSGKGMSAAMLMSNFQATLRANVKYNHENLTLIQLVTELNRSVYESAKGEKFITFFIGYYNAETRKLKYINSGHNYPIIVHNNEVNELMIGSTALGMFEELPTIESSVITIESNTLIVCYTDGLVEVENEQQEQFQTKRLKKAIQENSYVNMREINKAILREVDVFRGDNSFPDDTALLSLRII